MEVQCGKAPQDWLSSMHSRGRTSGQDSCPARRHSVSLPWATGSESLRASQAEECDFFVALFKACCNKESAVIISLYNSHMGIISHPMLSCSWIMLASYYSEMFPLNILEAYSIHFKQRGTSL